jgi:hypothetical protein
MRVCVVGGSKTGTTGLYAGVKAGLLESEGACYALNERHDRAVFDNLRRYAPEVPVVAKLLLTSASFSPDVVELFDKKLFVVRDPRDTLVSVALYYPVLAINRERPDQSIDRYVELVRRKEQDPGSVSFLELLMTVYRLVGFDVDQSTSFSRRFQLSVAYAQSASSFLVRYESLVADHLDDVSDYLGFPVANTRPSEYANTVLRSGGTGEWRDWFTERDVAHFRPMVADYMEHFGYEADWELADAPFIDPAYGSAYIRRACAKRRRQRAVLQARSSHSEEHLRQLRDRTADGAESAAYRLARLLWTADKEANGSEIHHCARFAAACGNVRAMRLLGRCFAEGIGVPPDPARARFWQDEANAQMRRRRGAG